MAKQYAAATVYPCRVERWATFDCYGTLVDWRGGIRGELARLFGAGRAEALLHRYYEVEPDVQQDGRLPYREVMSRTLTRIAGEFELAVPPAERDALAGSLPGWPVFPEVRRELLAARAGGWRLGILSNTDPDLIESSVAAIGVPFDLVVTASEIGSYKPAHRHWDVFRERTSADVDHHVHVAQSLFHDIAATSELGLPSVWINRLGEQPGFQPTRELPDLRGLAATLDELVPA